MNFFIMLSPNMFVISMSTYGNDGDVDDSKKEVTLAGCGKLFDILVKCGVSEWESEKDKQKSISCVN